MKKPNHPLPSGPGSYALLIELESPTAIDVGRLGSIEFRAGWYAYVGSALGGVSARVGRHLRQHKNLHWHVDYLLQEARLSEVTWALSEERMECRIAECLRRYGFSSVKGFGASDCRCPSHLFHSPNLKLLRNEIARAFSSAALTPNQYKPRV